MKILLLIACGLFSVVSFSGELTEGATVYEVASHSHAGWDGQNFAVRVGGGEGVCTGWIYFRQATAPSVETYNQSFSIALMALASSKEVRIHSYDSNSPCDDATFISVSR